jgi:hypothetical protein
VVSIQVEEAAFIMVPQVSLFATDLESVRLVTEEREEGVIQLHVLGPRERRASYTFNTIEICDQFRETIEVKLMRTGFARLATIERRRGR